MNPVAATGEGFNGVEPYAPEVAARYTLYPLTVLVLAPQESPTAWDEPESDTLAEFVALLATLALPLSTPVVVGANWIVRVAVWPGVSMSPELMPLPLKPVPVMVEPEIVMLEFPVFVSVIGSEALWPACTEPKLKFAGLAVSKCVAAAPVPVSGMFT